VLALRASAGRTKAPCYRETHPQLSCAPKFGCPACRHGKDASRTDDFSKQNCYAMNGRLMCYSVLHTPGPSPTWRRTRPGTGPRRRPTGHSRHSRQPVGWRSSVRPVGRQNLISRHHAKAMIRGVSASRGWPWRTSAMLDTVCVPTIVVREATRLGGVRTWPAPAVREQCSWRAGSGEYSIGSAHPVLQVACRVGRATIAPTISPMRRGA
jgi:hypothetical protein